MLITFPDTLHVLDAGHPDCLDWRRVTLSIEQHLQNMHLSFTLRRKAGGRSPSQIFDCYQFRAELDRITETFYRRIDPAFDEAQSLPLNPLFQMARSRGYGDCGKRSPAISFGFHGDQLPNFIEFSNHQSMQARQIFSEIARETAKRRDLMTRK